MPKQTVDSYLKPLGARNIDSTAQVTQALTKTTDSSAQTSSESEQKSARRVAELLCADLKSKPEDFAYDVLLDVGQEYDRLSLYENLLEKSDLLLKRMTLGYLESLRKANKIDEENPSMLELLQTRFSLLIDHFVDKYVPACLQTQMASLLKTNQTLRMQWIKYRTLVPVLHVILQQLDSSERQALSASPGYEYLLSWIVLKGSIETLRLLLSDQNAEQKHTLFMKKHEGGNTSYHLAAMRGRRDILKTMFTEVAGDGCAHRWFTALSGKNNSEQTPLDVARQKGHHSTVETIQEIGRAFDDSLNRVCVSLRRGP